jgi:hypothetical protein
VGHRKLCTKRTKTHKRSPFPRSREATRLRPNHTRKQLQPRHPIPEIGFDPQNRPPSRHIRDSRRESRCVTTPGHLNGRPQIVHKTHKNAQTGVLFFRCEAPFAGNRLRYAKSPRKIEPRHPSLEPSIGEQKCTHQSVPSKLAIHRLIQTKTSYLSKIGFVSRIRSVHIRGALPKDELYSRAIPLEAWVGAILEVSGHHILCEPYWVQSWPSTPVTSIDTF